MSYDITEIKDRTVVFRAPATLCEEVYKLADKEMRTGSDMFRILLQMGLKKHREMVLRSKKR